jgi:hypothetical protein
MARLDLPRLAGLSAGTRELDDLDWQTALVFRAYGVTIGVRVDDAAVLELLPPYLPFSWKSVSRGVVETLYSVQTRADPHADGSYVLYAGHEERSREKDLEAILHSLEREIRWELAEKARNRIFVHAGVVGWRGGGIVIPGTSGVGKSTLVTELVRAGATYYSDEYAVLDGQGRVHPFATQLQLRQSGTWDQERQTVESLGGRSGKRALPVGLVIAAVYRSGARTQLRRLTSAHAVLEMLKGTGGRARPLETLHALEQVANRAVVVQGERGEAKDFALELLGRLAMPWASWKEVLREPVFGGHATGKDTSSNRHDSPFDQEGTQKG